MRRHAGFVLYLLVICIGGHSQTTQGLIAGRVVDSLTGAAVADARVSAHHAATNTVTTSTASRDGYFVLPLLPPGSYRLRVSADRYQIQEVRELELAVAGRLDIGFRLRRLGDVWEAGRYRSVFLPDSDAILTFYGPDVDTSRAGSFVAVRGDAGTLETSLSHVIDPAQVRDLPLAGRDVYAMLLTLPGVAADAATGRSLGLSANGQRPGSSSFLLDGVENNNARITGPLAAVPPEAVQEYRVSTSSFSAEYGRTNGFLANAVTRSGGADWHGLAYYNLQNDALNANSFQRNLRGLDRPEARENQFGYHAGGPLLGLFLSSAFDHFRSRSHADPQDFRLPSTAFVDRFTAPNSIARRLLTQFPAPAVAAGNQPSGVLTLSPPASVDRSLALQRLDYRGPRHHILGRVALGFRHSPDFIYSPYPDFVSGLEQNSYSIAVAFQSALRPNLSQELRFGFLRDFLQWERAHPEIPTLIESARGAVLPGSLAAYGFRNPINGWEISENMVWLRGSQFVMLGGGVLGRSINASLTAVRDGVYFFGDIVDFGLDEPSLFSAAASRESLPAFRLPDYNRSYRQTEWFGFVQDTWR
ncbi:MAG: carboxypeptidase regulatory-like domain-containing protein, partial [Bryobacteraceae bacterium]